MKLRAAIRYSEYKNAKKLPSKVPESCDACLEKKEWESRNCEGVGNPKYTCKLGSMLFYQCPYSIPDRDTWDVIDLILTQEETHIPIAGTCLLDQTRKMFEFRRIIMNEKYECHEELRDKKGDNTGAAPVVEKRKPVSSRSRIPMAAKKK